MARIVLGDEAALHHVGIVCPDASLLEPLLTVASAKAQSAPSQVAFRHVPEFQCDCYLLGQIELVVPTNGAEGAPLAPLERWLKGRGTSLHHVAFEVEDVDAQAASLRKAGVPVVLEHAVQGVADLRVNFVHPSYCGFLVEFVEAP
jgi:methylmalonyl-CoA/ethylmalonyl-CoA epimerase